MHFIFVRKPPYTKYTKINMHTKYSGFTVHDSRPENIPSRSRSSASLSLESRASRKSVSRWIPRKVRDVVEASVFSSATGMPRYVQAARMISSQREQMSDAGGPAVKKWSRR